MFTFVQNGTAMAPVHVPAWAEAHEVFAAEELAAYIGKITGAKPDIRKGLKGIRGPAVVIADLGHPAAPRLLPDGLGRPLKLDGFRIKVEGPRLYIVSHEPSGVVAGVYGYLRACCGCAFPDLGEAGEIVPRRPDIVHAADTDVVDNPGFWMRGMQFALDQNAFLRDGLPSPRSLDRLAWMAKNGFNYVHSGFTHGDAFFDSLLPELKKRGLKLEFGHDPAFEQLVSPAEYYRERPDFYPFHDGQRLSARKLIPVCPSSRAAVETIVRNIERLMERCPSISILDLWPAENLVPACSCKACRKLADPADERPAEQRWLRDNSYDRGGEQGRRYGSRAKARQYLHLANQVAERAGRLFPRLKYSIVADGETTNPPAGRIQLHPNLYPCVALAWRSMSHSIDDAASPINRQFMNVIHEWLAVLDRPDKLFFYTYDMGMWGWWSLPYPALTDLFRDWTVFRRLGVGGDTIQAGSYHFAVYALNYLAVANVLRDAPRSLDAFLRAYCRDYFGEAAGVMERLIRSMEANFGRKAGVQIRPKPWLDIHRAFSPNHVAEWRRLVDRALALTENSLVRWRIERIRTLVNYIQLWLEAPRDIHLRTAAWAAKRGPCEFLRPYMKRRPTARETAVYERWLATLKQFAHESLLTGQGIFPHDFSKQRIY